MIISVVFFFYYTLSFFACRVNGKNLSCLAFKRFSLLSMFSCRLHSLENLSLLFFFWLKIETQFVKWKRHESIFSRSAIFTHSSVSCLLSPHCRCRESFSSPVSGAISLDNFIMQFPSFLFREQRVLYRILQMWWGKILPGKINDSSAAADLLCFKRVTRQRECARTPR